MNRLVTELARIATALEMIAAELRNRDADGEPRRVEPPRQTLPFRGRRDAA